MSVAKRIGRKVARKYNDAVTPGGDTYERLIDKSEKAGEKVMSASDSIASGILQLAAVIFIPIILLSCIL